MRNTRKLTKMLLLALVVLLVSSLLAVNTFADHDDAYSLISDGTNTIDFSDYVSTDNAHAYLYEKLGMYFTTQTGTTPTDRVSVANVGTTDAVNNALVFTNTAFVNGGTGSTLSEKYNKNKDIIDLFFSKYGPEEFTLQFDMTINSAIPATAQSTSSTASKYRGMSMISMGTSNWFFKATAPGIGAYVDTGTTTTVSENEYPVYNAAEGTANVGWLYGQNMAEDIVATADNGIAAVLGDRPMEGVVTSAISKEAMTSGAVQYTVGVPFTVKLAFIRGATSTDVVIYINNTQLDTAKIGRSVSNQAFGIRFLDGEVNTIIDNLSLTINKNCGDNHGGFGSVEKIVEATDGSFTIEKYCNICNTSYGDCIYAVDANEPFLTKETFTIAAPSTISVNDEYVDKSASPYWISFDLDITSFDIDTMLGVTTGTLTPVGGRNLFGWMGGIYPNILRMFLVTDGTTDGYLSDRVELRLDNLQTAPYVATLMAGENYSFDIRTVPSKGFFEVYINGIFAGSYTNASTVWPDDDAQNTYTFRFFEGGKWGDMSVSNFKIFKDVHNHIADTSTKKNIIVGDDIIVTEYACTVCGKTLEGISEVVVDRIPNITDGIETVAVNTVGEYWITSDIHIRQNVNATAPLITLGETAVVTMADVGEYTAPTTVQFAIKVNGTSVEIYKNGTYFEKTVALETAPASVTFGSTALGEAVRYNYNKIVKLGNFDVPELGSAKVRATPSFVEDDSIIPCLHVGVNNRMSTIYYTEGLKYTYICTKCGEKIYEDVNVPLYCTMDSNDKSSFTLSSSAFNNITSDAASMGATADKYWISFDLTLMEMPSEGASVLYNGGGGRNILNFDGTWNSAIRIYPISDTSSSTGYDEDSVAIKSKGGAITDFCVVDVGDTVNFSLYVDPSAGTVDFYLDGVWVLQRSSGVIGTSATTYKMRFGDGVAWKWSFTDFIFAKATAHVCTGNHLTETFEMTPDGLRKVAYTCYCGTKVAEEVITSNIGGNISKVINGTGSVALTLPTDGAYYVASDINVKTAVEGALLTLGTDVVLDASEISTVPTTVQTVVKVNGTDYSVYLDGKYYKSGTLTAAATSLVLGNNTLTDGVYFRYTKAVTLGAKPETPVLPAYTVADDNLTCDHAVSDGSMRFYVTDGVTYSGSLKLVNKLINSYICSKCGERIYTEQGNILGVNIGGRASTLPIGDDGQSSATISGGNYVTTDLSSVGANADPFWITFDMSFTLSKNQIETVINSKSQKDKTGGSFLALMTEKHNIYIQMMRVYATRIDTSNTNLADTTNYYYDRLGFSDNSRKVKDDGSLEGGKIETVLMAGQTYNVGVYIEPSYNSYTFTVYIDGKEIMSRTADTKTETKAYINASDNFNIRFLDGNYGSFSFSNLAYVRARDAVYTEPVDIENVGFGDNTTVIELNAAFETTSSLEEYYPLATLNNDHATLNVLYVNGATGALAYRETDTGNFVEIGKTLTSTPERITVVYDEVTGLLRYYDSENLIIAGVKAYNDYFHYVTGTSSKISFLESAEGGIKATVTVASADEYTDGGIFNIGTTATAEIVGIQTNDTTRDLRIVSGLDTRYYTKVGYEATLFVNGAASVDGDNNDIVAEQESNIIFSSIIADDKIVHAETHNHKYLATLTVGNVMDNCDFDNNTYYLIVTPYTLIGTAKTYGEPVKINITSEGYTFDADYTLKSVASNLDSYDFYIEDSEKVTNNVNFKGTYTKTDETVVNDGFAFVVPAYVETVANLVEKGDIILSIDASEAKSVTVTVDETATTVDLTPGRNFIVIADNIDAGDHTVKIAYAESTWYNSARYSVINGLIFNGTVSAPAVESDSFVGDYDSEAESSNN